MITALIFILLLVVMSFLSHQYAIRLWWRFQLKRYTRKARYAKATWLSTKESTVDSKKATSSWRIAEGRYCDALIMMRTYEKLVSPMVAVPYDDEKKAG